MRWHRMPPARDEPRVRRRAASRARPSRLEASANTAPANSGSASHDYFGCGTSLSQHQPGSSAQKTMARSNRRMRKTTRRMLLGLTCSAHLMMACGNEDCDVALAECDADSCQVVIGVPLSPQGQRGTPIEAGCADKDRGASDIETGARDGGNACWVFPTGLLPFGFTAAQECLR